MKLLRRFLARITDLFPNTRREDDLTTELEPHVSLVTEANLRAGMSPIEARRRALQELGGLEHTAGPSAKAQPFPSSKTSSTTSPSPSASSSEPNSLHGSHQSS